MKAPISAKTTRASILRAKKVQEKLAAERAKKMKEERRLQKKKERLKLESDSLRSAWDALDRSRKGRFTLKQANEKAERYRKEHTKSKLKKKVKEMRHQIEEKLKSRPPLWMRESIELKKRKAKIDALKKLKDCVGDDEFLEDILLTHHEKEDLEIARENSK